MIYRLNQLKLRLTISHLSDIIFVIVLNQAKIPTPRRDTFRKRLCTQQTASNTMLNVGQTNQMNLWCVPRN